MLRYYVGGLTTLLVLIGLTSIERMRAEEAPVGESPLRFIEPAPTAKANGIDGADGAVVPAPAKVAPDSAKVAPEPSNVTPTREPLSRAMAARRDKLRSVLAMYYPKLQNTRDNNSWEVMHEIIAYGVDARLYRGGSKGPTVNAIGWLCFNGTCKGEQMLYLDRGKLVARKGPGLQGHFGQFLAILAQSHVKIDYPMQVGGKAFTLRDLVEHEKLDCQAGEELTFKLIGLMHYLDSDETWRSRDGQEWSIQRLIAEELKQPIRGAACGGTHRLMGLSYAVNKRIKRGQPVVGEFRRAQMFIQDYHRYTFALQNPDGSFSTQWFNRPEAKPDVDRRLKTTGHILEWLTFSLSDEELREPRVTKAVDYLAGILANGPDHAWEIGPVGHGLHALAIYDRRLFRDVPGATNPALARRVTVRGEKTQRPPAADRPVLEMAERLPLWGGPACSIGNEAELKAPDAAIPPGDADDEGCL